MNDDFVHMIELLNKHEVEYCLIGGFAYSYYVESRATKDIDILIKPELKNMKKAYRAIKEFGFTLEHPTPEELLKSKEIIYLGHVPERIDLLQDITNVPDKEIWPQVEKGSFKNVETNYIGLKQLIKNKISAGRPQDKSDVVKLKEYHPKEYKEVIEEIKRNPI